MVKSALKDTKSNLTPPYSYPKSRDNGSSLFTATAGSMTLANSHERWFGLFRLEKHFPQNGGAALASGRLQPLPAWRFF